MGLARTHLRPLQPVSHSARGRVCLQRQRLAGCPHKASRTGCTAQTAVTTQRLAEPAKQTARASSLASKGLQGRATLDDISCELAAISDKCLHQKDYLQTPRDTAALLEAVATAPGLGCGVALQAAEVTSEWGAHLHKRWFDSFTQREISSSLWSLGQIYHRCGCAAPQPTPPDQPPPPPTSSHPLSPAIPAFTSRLLLHFMSCASTGRMLWQPDHNRQIAQALDGMWRLCSCRAASAQEYHELLQLALVKIGWQLQHRELDGDSLGQVGDLVEAVCLQLGLAAPDTQEQQHQQEDCIGEVLTARQHTEAVVRLREAVASLVVKLKQLLPGRESLQYSAAALSTLAAARHLCDTPQPLLQQVANKVARQLAAEHELSRPPRRSEVEQLLQVLHSFLRLGYSPGELLLLTTSSRLQLHLRSMSAPQLCTTVSLLAAHDFPPGASFLAAASRRALELGGSLELQQLAAICASLVALGHRPDDALLLRLVQLLVLSGALCTDRGTAAGGSSGVRRSEAATARDGEEVGVRGVVWGEGVGPVSGRGADSSWGSNSGCSGSGQDGGSGKVQSGGDAAHAFGRDESAAVQSGVGSAGGGLPWQPQTLQAALYALESVGQGAYAAEVGKLREQVGFLSTR